MNTTNHTPGPMENLLEGLDQHAQFLSKEELKAELSGRGIDADALLKQTHEIIAQHEVVCALLDALQTYAKLSNAIAFARTPEQLAEGIKSLDAHTHFTARAAISNAQSNASDES